MNRSITFLISVLFFLPTQAISQDDIKIDIVANEGVATRALDPIEFSVSLSLPEAGHDVAPSAAPTIFRLSVNELNVRPVGLLADEYSDRAECQFRQQGLRLGSTLSFPCLLYPKDDGIKTKLVPAPSALFARYVLLEAKVDFTQLDEKFDQVAVTRLPVLPPLVSVFYGGMAGAFLLALFRGLAPFRHGWSRDPPKLPASWRDFLAQAATRALYMFRAMMVTTAWLVLGGVSAIMIIILTKASTGDVSPIQIDVQDFVGGVLVGLLSFPVVDWLEKKLVASEVPGSAPSSTSLPEETAGNSGPMPPAKTGSENIPD